MMLRTVGAYLYGTGTNKSTVKCPYFGHLFDFVTFLHCQRIFADIIYFTQNMYEGQY